MNIARILGLAGTSTVVLVAMTAACSTSKTVREQAEPAAGAGGSGGEAGGTGGDGGSSSTRGGSGGTGGASGGSSGASGSAGSGGSGGSSGASGSAGSGGHSGSGGATENADGLYGEIHEGQYHLGPVDFAETEWHNACAPGGGYAAALRDATGLGGEYLAGVSNTYADGGGVCDACIQITTATGRSIVARVATYGATNEPGDVDVSPSVYEALNTDEYPRYMTWQFAKCPDTGPLRYEFQTEANPWWTSLWVRNPRVPLVSVEVQSANHSTYFTLRRETDGTLNDDGGFGEGEFTLRLTAMDGQIITDTLPGFSAGETIVSDQQFE